MNNHNLIARYLIARLCSGEQVPAKEIIATLREQQQRIEELEDIVKRLDAALDMAMGALKALSYQNRYAAKKLKKVEKARAGE
jgi:hypothetical protein